MPSPDIAPASPRNGSALVIALMAVVLITTLILAFFAQAQAQRQISFSSAGMSKTERLALTAVEIITGDLLNEIKAGSTVITSSSTPIYLPVANYASIPQLAGNQNITNLIKVSAANVRPWKSDTKVTYTTEGPLRSILGNSTTNAASNGRMIPLKRWLKPSLVLATQSNSLPAPDWIVVTRRGTVDATAAPSVTLLGNSASTNSQYAIGRFAYAMYNEGSLLDVNMAGYPSGEPVSETGRKGFLAFADLTRIPNGSIRITQRQVDALVAWRNASGSSSYYNYLTNYAVTNGFRRVRPNDQLFVTRQDLISYADKNGLTNSLPYLGTFSREKNTACWTPHYNAVDLGGSNGTGNVYAYKDRANLSTSANRNLANARATDGTLLIKKRFPLQRLSLLEGGNTSDISLYFGLSGISGQWTYNHGNNAKILTLEEVRKVSPSRQPDFFELLKAVILEGSLGRDAGGNICSQPQGTASVDNHIIQIGANIIDQYDRDNLPTTIRFNGRDFYGVENLPYLTRALYYCYVDPTDTNQPSNYPANRVIAAWLQPELWRPYQDPGSSAGQAMPARVRLQVSGVMQISRSTTAYPTFLNKVDGTTTTFSGTELSKGQIEFDPSLIPYDKPAGLSLAHGATAPNSLNLRPTWPGQPAAVYLGYVAYSASAPHITTTPKPSLTLELQWSSDGSTWHTYSQIEQIVSGPTHSLATASGGTTPLTFFAKVDPRTDRFGVSLGWTATGGGSGYALNQSLRPTSGTGYFLTNKLPNATGFTFSSSTQGYLGLLSDNKSGTSAYYADKDGVIRRAAGAYTDGTGTDGYPLIPSATSTDNTNGRRPIVLNRPFQSIGELGYAFRDLPFKELDFFTKESADAGLLDVFTLYDEPEITSGRVSLNTPYPEVLEAILYGSIKREFSTSDKLDTDASKVARTITDYVSTNGPLLDRSELVTRVSDSLSSAFFTTADKYNKTQRESVIRALADVTNQRTWNIMIDILCQSGRYPATAQNINQFVVEGEKRYWVHLAIDRYTGEIVDRVIESVNE